MILSQKYTVRRELRITPTLDALLRREADRLGRGVSEVMRIAVAEYFERPLSERAACLAGPDVAEIQRLILCGARSAE